MVCSRKKLLLLSNHDLLEAGVKKAAPRRLIWRSFSLKWLSLRTNDTYNRPIGRVRVIFVIFLSCHYLGTSCVVLECVTYCASKCSPLLHWLATRHSSRVMYKECRVFLHITKINMYVGLHGIK